MSSEEALLRPRKRAAHVLVLRPLSSEVQAQALFEPQRKPSERKSSPSSNLDAVSVRSSSGVGSSAPENAGVGGVPKSKPRANGISVDSGVN